MDLTDLTFWAAFGDAMIETLAGICAFIALFGAVRLLQKEEEKTR